MSNQLKHLTGFARGNRVSKEKNRNFNAVIYTRVSSKEQLDNMSLETQLKGCRSFAEKCKYNVCGFFGGTYESAMSDERKEFVRMIDYVKKSKEKISYIIVYSLERFSRTGDNAIWLSRQLRELGVTIVSVTQPIDTSNPSGVLQQNILFLFSQYDNDLRRQKCVAGMKEKLLKGEWLGSLPLGYSYAHSYGAKEQKIVFNDDAPLIKKAFMMKLNKKLTNVEIEKRMKEMGLRLTTKRLTDTLRNPFYCGYISHKLLDGEVVRGKHPALISEDVFLEVNDIVKKNAQGYRVSEENEHLPMKRVIRCAKCNSFLTGYVRKKVLKSGRELQFHYYKCHVKGCKVNLSVKVVHEQLVALLERYQLDKRCIPLMKDLLKMTYENLTEANVNEKASMNAKLGELKGKLEKVEERFAYGEIDRGIYDKIGEKLKEEIRLIEGEIEKSHFTTSNPSKLIEKGILFASELVNWWENGDYEERKMALDILFPEGIIYDKNNEGFRTSQINAVIDVIAVLSDTYIKEKKATNPFLPDLSPSVARRGIEPLFPE